MVDFAGCTVTGEQAIAYLWEDRPNDESTRALMRMTAKRLRDVLREESIEDILIEEKGVRAIDISKVDCDYYMLMAGDRKMLKKYHGEYMAEYSWAEVTNARLAQIAGDYRNQQI